MKGYRVHEGLGTMWGYRDHEGYGDYERLGTHARPCDNIFAYEWQKSMYSSTYYLLSYLLHTSLAQLQMLLFNVLCVTLPTPKLSPVALQSFSAPVGCMWYVCVYVMCGHFSSATCCTHCHTHPLPYTLLLLYSP